jgi:hypothetical protein
MTNSIFLLFTVNSSRVVKELDIRVAETVPDSVGMQVVQVNIQQEEEQLHRSREKVVP